MALKHTVTQTTEEGKVKQVLYTLTYSEDSHLPNGSEIQIVKDIESGSIYLDTNLDIVPEKAGNAPTIPDAARTANGHFVQPAYWEELCLYLMQGQCRPGTAIVGGAGNGKTTAAQKAFESLGYDYFEYDCTEETQAADLVGDWSYHPTEGDVWKQGIVEYAFEQGKALLLNEFDALNPRVALAMQSAFQDRGVDGLGRYIATKRGKLYPTADCPIVLTMNTYGGGANRMYVGRNALDAATRDRLSMVSADYENEAPILVAHGYDAHLAIKIVSWAKTMRAKIEKNEERIILSNRTLLRMAQAISVYKWSFEKAVEKEFFSRLDADQRTVLSK